MENFELIKKSGILVYLKTHLGVLIIEGIESQTEVRPLFFNLLSLLRD